MSMTAPEPVDYAGRNAALFAERDTVLREIEDLAGRAKRSAKARREIVRARRRLDDVETEIVRVNKGLVISYARLFARQGSHQDMEDFEAAGTAGLVAAMRSYDPSRGPFAQWAYHPIQRAVTRAVRDADHPNMNPGDFERRPDVLRAVERIRDRGDVVTDDAVAAEAGTTVGQVKRILQAPPLVSGDLPIGEDGGGTLAELVADPAEAIEDRVENDLFQVALVEFGYEALDMREMYVLTKHFGLDGSEPQKLATIGSTLDLSREAARQIEAKALAKLSHPVVLRKLVRHRG